MFDLNPTEYIKLLNYEEAAERLTVSEKSLRRYVQQGIVPYRRIGRFVRFTESDLTKFIEASAQGGDV